MSRGLVGFWGVVAAGADPGGVFAGGGAGAGDHGDLEGEVERGLCEGGEALQRAVAEAGGDEDVERAGGEADGGGDAGELRDEGEEQAGGSGGQREGAEVEEGFEIAKLAGEHAAEESEGPLAAHELPAALPAGSLRGGGGGVGGEFAEDGRAVEEVDTDTRADEVEVVLEVFDDGVGEVGDLAQRGCGEGKAVAEDAAGEAEAGASAGAQDVHAQQSEALQASAGAGVRVGGDVAALQGLRAAGEGCGDLGEQVGRDGGVGVNDQDGLGPGFERVGEAVVEGCAFAVATLLVEG